MLPRHRRLTSELVEQTLLSGKLFHSPFFTLTAMKVAPDVTKKTLLSRFSAIAPKKFFKTAVERNKVRRRLYA
ncbi:MAG: ribonuclease P protein component, partial [bacterium]